MSQDICRLASALVRRVVRMAASSWLISPRRQLATSAYPMACDEVMKAPNLGLTRIYGPDREFLGLAEVTGMGNIVPRRLLSQETAA